MAFRSSSRPLTRHEISTSVAQLDKVLYSVRSSTKSKSTVVESESPLSLISDATKFSFGKAQTLLKVVRESMQGHDIDDKTYIMERVIQLAAELPLRSQIGKGLTNSFLTKLWKDLDHPPLCSLHAEQRYRTANGSNNNPMNPQVGAAGSSYARTVSSRTMNPALPDPDLVFDSILARKSFNRHPNQISSVLFHFAALITHDLFRTRNGAPDESATSSYLDLSPLYGSNQEEQDQIRTFKEGKLKVDCFSDARINALPPGVGLLLIMFNRFHNNTVEQLARINEDNRFKRPESKNKDALLRFDNDLFQTGRLITCGLYVNIVLKDYVRTILNLNRTHSLWSLDPRSRLENGIFRDAPQHVLGNQVSVEFNLVYRWHATISRSDEKLTKKLFKTWFKGQSGREVSAEHFLRMLGETASKVPTDPAARPFAGLQRHLDGRLSDDKLAALFTKGVEDCAGAFGANHTPVVLRAIETLAIKRARSWKVATLNEFRHHFHLTPHKTFLDINSDPNVAEQLERLYGHPEFVELYPGLMVEDAKESVVPGSGLCTSFTISRAVLSDAVSLVKGDRFYTVDYTPQNLTNWGFALVDSNLDIDYGCNLYKLVLGAFPRRFGADSVYAHYPLVIPEENQKILTDLGRSDDYSFTKGGPALPPVSIHSYTAVQSLLAKSTFLKAMPVKSTAVRRSGYAVGEDASNRMMRSIMHHVLAPLDWRREVELFYESTTLKLLHSKAYKVAGQNEIDIVRDVLNPVLVRFVSWVFSLPLQTEENPGGFFTDAQLLSIMTALSATHFQDTDPVKSFVIDSMARSSIEKLAKLVEMNMKRVGSTGLFQCIREAVVHHEPPTGYGEEGVQRLVSSQVPAQELIHGQVLPTAASLVHNQSRVFAQCLDYFLSDAGKAHLPDIHRLAQAGDQQAVNRLDNYFLEGSRLGYTTAVVREASGSFKVSDGNESVKIATGQRVVCNVADASRDPSVFHNPDKVDLTRDIALGLHCKGSAYPDGEEAINKVALTTMFRTIGKLTNLRRAAGPMGELKKVPGEGGDRFMTLDQSRFLPFPESMKVHWDGELPELKL